MMGDWAPPSDATRDRAGPASPTEAAADAGGGRNGSVSRSNWRVPVDANIVVTRLDVRSPGTWRHERGRAAVVVPGLIALISLLAAAYLGAGLGSVPLAVLAGLLGVITAMLCRVLLRG